MGPHFSTTSVERDRLRVRGLLRARRRRCTIAVRRTCALARPLSDQEVAQQGTRVCVTHGRSRARGCD